LHGGSSFSADGRAIASVYPVLVEEFYIRHNGGDGFNLNSYHWDGNARGVVVRRNQVVRFRQNGIKLWAGGLVENNLVWILRD